MSQATPKSGIELPATVSPGPSSEAHIAAVRDSQPVVLFDQADPRSLLNLLSKPIRKVVEDTLFDYRAKELIAMDEADLYKHIKSSGGVMTITPTDNRLRFKFWMEYDYCQAYMAKEIDHRRVIAGICTYEHFTRRFLTTPHKMAWLLCPPTGYAVKVNEALEFGLDQLRDILEAEHRTGEKVDTKLGELKLKIVALLDTRAKGAPVQRQIVANLSGNAAAQAAQMATSQNNAEAMETKLKELEKKERELMNGGSRMSTVIDIEV